jgi:G3E family GTPase
MILVTTASILMLAFNVYRAVSYKVPNTRFFEVFSTTLFSTKLQNIDAKIESTKIPVTVLSGFLGSGKTSFLQKLVNSNENNKNRIGLVVNDMAAVNIDAKQIKQQTLGTFDGIDTMELQNGCVCCTLAEDLLASVTRLVTLSDLKGYTYDHIIVECSGIAEPRKIRDLFQEAEDFGSNLINRIKLDTLITVVDAEVFNNLFGSDVNISENSELAFTPEELKKNAMFDDEFGQRKITELLLEQVECADIILINKCDLLEKKSDVELVKKVRK